VLGHPAAEIMRRLGCLVYLGNGPAAERDEQFPGAAPRWLVATARGDRGTRSRNGVTARSPMSGRPVRRLVDGNVAADEDVARRELAPSWATSSDHTTAEWRNGSA